MTLVIAHRGASAARPENTVAAFELAAELGADWVELDVRLTRCGTPVAHHDAELADGRVIAGLDVTELPDDVPTLAAALRACGDMGVNIEIKSEPEDPDYDEDHALVDATVAVATAILPFDRILITSFDMSAINRVHDIDARVPTGFLTSDPVGAEVSVGRAVAHGHRALNPDDALVTARYVDVAHEAGLLVYPWTIDDPTRMAELIRFGVDGIITNRPDVARSVVDAG